jgi:HEPN domain-containing protein
MCSLLPEKGNLETNVRNYLTCSYYLGYDLDLYFTEKHQIIMFERLLSCDTIFKQEWENGVYSIPEDPTHTMSLSLYIKKQSSIKKLSRKINKYTSNHKLTEGAKNLLQAYMIKNSQEYTGEGKDRNMNTRMEEMFCGIMKQISDRKKSYITKKLPDDVATEIEKYVSSGGTKRKRFAKTKKRYRSTKNVKSTRKRSVIYPK